MHMSKQPPFNRLYLLKEDDIGECVFLLLFFWVGGGGVIKSACVERKQDYRANLNMFNVIDTVLHLSSSCLL